MLTFIAIIHVFIALILILFVLLHDPKGGAMGVFGGGGGANAAFGATGATNFLTKATRWMAIVFAITCLVLAYMTTTSPDSVMDDFVPAAAPPQQNVPQEETSPGLDSQENVGENGSEPSSEAPAEEPASE